MKYSSLAGVEATRIRLEELGLHTKKHFGQHFLIDDGVVGKIIRLAAVQANSAVVEVGPGIGTLTEALLNTKALLHLVEVDATLWPGLQQRYSKALLIQGDALDSSVIAEVAHQEPVSLVSNLAYAVAATIILEYFQALPSLQNATVMVQREVADRIAAEPGCKDYGSYTIKLRLLAKVTSQFKVARQSFYPPPRVDSTVVRLERTAAHTPLLASACMLADAAFFQRRKTIANSMRAYFKTQEEALAKMDVPALLKTVGIAPTVRGETLPPEAFITLAEALVC